MSGSTDAAPPAAVDAVDIAATAGVVAGRMPRQVTPSAPVAVPGLEQTVLGLFRLPAAGGGLPAGATEPDVEAVVLVTPSGGVGSRPDDGPALAQLQALVDGVEQALGPAAARIPWTVALVAMLRRASDSGAFVRGRQLDESGALAHLGEVTFPGMPGAPAYGRVDADDFVHSLVLVAPPGTALTCCNARELAPEDGAVRVVVGPSGFLRIDDLRPVPPVAVPADAVVEVLAPPAGSYAVNTSMSWPGAFPAARHDITGFGGELSSLSLHIPTA